MLNKAKIPRKQRKFSFTDEAYRSFSRKNYDNAVIILEKGYSSGDTNPYTLFLLAVSLIYSNNFSRAGVILEHLQRVSPLYEPFLQLRSFLALKSAASREQAMRVYVSALEKLPADPVLRKALRILEKSGDFSAFQKRVRLEELVDIPKPRGMRSRQSDDGGDYRVKRRRKNTIPGIIFVSVGIICAVVFAASALYYSSLLDRFKGDRQKPAGSDLSGKVDMVDLGGAGYGIINRINSEKTPEFYASGDLVVSDFNEARRLIKKGEYNSGVIILNRIINSNSSFIVKEKCEFLIRFVMESDERSYEEMDVAKLNEKPYLYRGSSVKLAGKAVNIKQVRGGRSFTLMVEYDGTNFRGITLVFDSKATELSNGDMVEVRGLFITGMGKGNVPYISAEDIRRTQ